MSARVLFLSPHLDDVAFSCPLQVRAERRAGNRVAVATVFSAGDARHAERRREDASALTLLEAEALHLELPDAPIRDPRLSTFSALLLERRDEPATQREVARVVRELVERERPQRIYAPLGVGGHVDHRLVYEAARALAGEHVVRFYEDRPYALVSGATTWRLRELGSDAAVDRGALLRELWRAPYVRTFLHRRDLLPLARHLRAKPRSAPASWQSEIVRHGDEAIDFAIEVARAYASQWLPFHGSEAQHRSTLRASSEELGAPYAERFWTVEG